MNDPRRVIAVPRLSPRAPDAHKGDFGYDLVIGGSRGMAGAVSMVAQSAMRSGAGKTTAAIPESLYPIVAGHLVVCTTMPLREQPDGTLALDANDRIAEVLSGFHVVAYGPGLGRNEGLARLTEWLLANVPVPMVIDADGLNNLASVTHRLSDRRAPTVLTPHPGEMARLVARSTADVQANRLDVAMEFARRTDTIVVLKGPATIVADGERYYVNTTGNPGMATGGSGDVLTGVIAALLGAGMTPFDGAVLGVYVHGLAGDLARDIYGETSIVATDIVDRLPDAFQDAARSR